MYFSSSCGPVMDYCTNRMYPNDDPALAWGLLWWTAAHPTEQEWNNPENKTKVLRFKDEYILKHVTYHLIFLYFNHLIFSEGEYKITHLSSTQPSPKHRLFQMTRVQLLPVQ